MVAPDLEVILQSFFVGYAVAALHTCLPAGAKKVKVRATAVEQDLDAAVDGVCYFG